MLRRRSPFVALVLTALLVAPAGVANAHDELIGTDPEDGAIVEALDLLTLEFSGDIASLGAQVAVTDADGESVVEGAPQVNGTVLEQDLVDDLAAGEYEVLWRVTSQDGHPISGDFRFSVEAVAQGGGVAAGGSDDGGSGDDGDGEGGGDNGGSGDGAPEDSASDESSDDSTSDATDDGTDDGTADGTAAATSGETTAPAEETTAPTDAATATATATEVTEDADVTAGPEEAQGEGGLPVWAWVLVALGAAGLIGLLGRTWARGRE